MSSSTAGLTYCENINGLDGDVSFDLQRTDHVQGNAVLEQVNLLPIHIYL